MRCSQIREMIEDYHDGELDVRRAAEVAAHLRDCAECGRELALLENEEKVYQAYARRVQDSLALPPGLLERALREDASSRAPARTRWTEGLFSAPVWLRQGLAAAFLVLVSVTGTLLLVRHYRAESTPPQQQMAAAAGGERSLEAALQSIRHAEQEYLNAIGVLTDIIDKQKSTLDPRLVAELEQNLRMIDEHIAATRKAYYAQPGNADLALYMLAAYSRKVELLQDLTS
ncbi:MAG: putative transrane transcriptional regulator (anti-sigma factor) [Acidobacteria bacterium]|nr:putative transrane transcriptional regulator (anti-sigma factor) [Acidobacteriota bacterium]